VPPLPKADFKEPGWIVREGQAVWTLPHDKGEIAGEVLVATRTEDSRGFVQFSKAFPLVLGQIGSNQWEVEFPPEHRRYSGRGQPPQRVIWLYLPRVMQGERPPQNWSWNQDTNGWRLENVATKESLEGAFIQ
jgi:hypothetical protein